jgi:hypothetical protein
MPQKVTQYWPRSPWSKLKSRLAWNKLTLRSDKTFFRLIFKEIRLQNFYLCNLHLLDKLECLSSAKTAALNKYLRQTQVSRNLQVGKGTKGQLTRTKVSVSFDDNKRSSLFIKMALGPVPQKSNGTPLSGLAPALLVNIRLGQKWLTESDKHSRLLRCSI